MRRGSSGEGRKKKRHRKAPFRRGKKVLLPGLRKKRFSRKKAKRVGETLWFNERKGKMSTPNPKKHQTQNTAGKERKLKGRRTKKKYPDRLNKTTPQKQEGEGRGKVTSTDFTGFPKYTYHGGKV